MIVMIVAGFVVIIISITCTKYGDISVGMLATWERGIAVVAVVAMLHGFDKGCMCIGRRIVLFRVSV